MWLQGHILYVCYLNKNIFSPCYETWRIKTVAHVCIYWVLQMSSLGGGLTIHPLVPAFTQGRSTSQLVLGWDAIQKAEFCSDRKWDSARRFWSSAVPSPQCGVFWCPPSFCLALLAPWLQPCGPQRRGLWEHPGKQPVLIWMTQALLPWSEESVPAVTLMGVGENEHCPDLRAPFFFPSVRIGVEAFKYIGFFFFKGGFLLEQSHTLLSGKKQGVLYIVGYVSV